MNQSSDAKKKRKQRLESLKRQFKSKNHQYQMNKFNQTTAKIKYEEEQIKLQRSKSELHKKLLEKLDRDSKTQKLKSIQHILKQERQQQQAEEFPDELSIQKPTLVKKSLSAVRSKLKSVKELISLHKQQKNERLELKSLTKNSGDSDDNSLSETFNIKEMMDLKKQQRHEQLLKKSESGTVSLQVEPCQFAPDCQVDDCPKCNQKSLFTVSYKRQSNSTQRKNTNPTSLQEELQQIKRKRAQSEARKSKLKEKLLPGDSEDSGELEEQIQIKKLNSTTPNRSKRRKGRRKRSSSRGSNSSHRSGKSGRSGRSGRSKTSHGSRRSRGRRKRGRKKTIEKVIDSDGQEKEIVVYKRTKSYYEEREVVVDTDEEVVGVYAKDGSFVEQPDDAWMLDRTLTTIETTEWDEDHHHEKEEAHTHKHDMDPILKEEYLYEWVHERQFKVDGEICFDPKGTKKHAFVKKVYLLLLLQWFLTTLVCIGLFLRDETREMINSNTIIFYAFFGVLALAICISISSMTKKFRARVGRKNMEGALFFFFSLLHMAIFGYLCCVASKEIMLMVSSYIFNALFCLTVYTMCSKKPYVMPQGLHEKKLKKVKSCTYLTISFIILLGSSVNLYIFTEQLNFETIHIFWVAFLGMLYALYISYNAKIMAGGFHHLLQPDDYLMAAIISHVDFIPLLFMVLNDLDKQKK